MRFEERGCCVECGGDLGGGYIGGTNSYGEQYEVCHHCAAGLWPNEYYQSEGEDDDISNHERHTSII